MGALGLAIVLIIAAANVPSRSAQRFSQPGGTLPPTPSSQAAASSGLNLPGPTGEMRFLVPYRTTMKDNFRLLPCCNVGKALVFWESVMGDREQLFKAGYASDAPIVEEGSTVAVTAFYKIEFNGSAGEFRVSTDDANTRAGLLNAVALITTPGGTLGYVPALYVFPP